MMFRIDILTIFFVLLLVAHLQVVADQEGEVEIDFEVDLDEADQLLEKLRLKANITYDEPGIQFIATTNTRLIPARLDNRRRRKVRSTNAMMRRTDAFGFHFKGGVGLRIDVDGDDFAASVDLEDRSDVEVIRGTTEPFNNYKAKVLTVHHGLIDTVLEAYNNHLNLRLRPDDIWITILMQFSSYVNGEGRAEKLRSKFVAHQGQKKLQVNATGNIYTVDFGDMTRRMLNEMALHIKDDSLRSWFLPGFSTSTSNDDVCASAAAMCTMQTYFKYLFHLTCGIPEVTLLGEVADWESLRMKIDRLLEFQVDGDDSLATWVGLLQRICDNFVESSKNGSENNMKFWDTIAHRIEGGSFDPFLSGWITAFSYYDSEGTVVSTPTGTFEDGSPKWDLSTMTNGFVEDTSDKFTNNQDVYSSWPIIVAKDISSNVVSCPVEINDNGISYDSRLFVGQMALDYLRASRAMKDRATPIAKRKRGNLRVVQGRNDWALVIAKRQ